MSNLNETPVFNDPYDLDNRQFEEVMRMNTESKTPDTTKLTSQVKPPENSSRERKDMFSSDRDLMREKDAVAKENKRKEWKEKTKKWYKVFLVQAVIALISSILAMVLIFVINPSFIQKKTSEPWAVGRPDLKLILITGVTVLILVLLIPEVIRLVTIMVQKQKYKKEASK